MANEFEILMNDGNGRPVRWRCRMCNVQIRDSNKPRGHVCSVQPAPQPRTSTARTSTPNSDSYYPGPGTPFSPTVRPPGPPIHGYPFTPNPNPIHFNPHIPPPAQLQQQSHQAMWEHWHSQQEQRLRTTRDDETTAETTA